MTLMGTISQTDLEVIDHDLDMGRWLADGDTIDSAAASIEGSTETATTLVAGTPQVTDDLVKVRLSGGVPGESATLMLLVTAASGQEKEATWRVRITEH